MQNVTMSGMRVFSFLTDFRFLSPKTIFIIEKNAPKCSKWVYLFHNFPGGTPLQDIFSFFSLQPTPMPAMWLYINVIRNHSWDGPYLPHPPWRCTVPILLDWNHLPHVDTNVVRIVGSVLSVGNNDFLMAVFIRKLYPWFSSKLCRSNANVTGYRSLLMKSTKMGLVVVALTHWGRDKMDAFSQTIFSSAFSWMKMFEFRLKFHWSLCLRVQLTIFHHWFR